MGENNRPHAWWFLYTTALVVTAVGCGDSTVPAVPGSHATPVEAPCDLSGAVQGAFYFYAEVPAQKAPATVFTCTEQVIPILPPVCTPTDLFSVDEDGVMQLLCGQIPGSSKPADFVRLVF